MLLIADSDTAGTFWVQHTATGTVLERGPELVRSAAEFGPGLALRGDTAQPSDLEIWAPPGVRFVSWDGEPMALRVTQAGSLLASRQLPGAAPVTLPDLSKAQWRSAPGSPEADPSFDDSSWASADKTQTASAPRLRLLGSRC